MNLRTHNPFPKPKGFIVEFWPAGEDKTLYVWRHKDLIHFVWSPESATTFPTREMANYFIHRNFDVSDAPGEFCVSGVIPCFS